MKTKKMKTKKIKVNVYSFLGIESDKPFSDIEKGSCILILILFCWIILPVMLIYYILVLVGMQFKQQVYTKEVEEKHDFEEYY